VFRDGTFRWFRHALLLGGIALVALGLWPTRPSTAPRLVVTAFMQAMERGDRTAALKLMGDDARAKAQGPAFPEIWQPSKHFSWKLQDLRVDGGSALARVGMRDQGFFVESELLLTRQPAGTWEITALNIARVDPRYAERERRLAEEADERLVRDLRDSLRGSPAVLTELPDDEPRR
jgi:hypothetical protein